MYPVIVPPREAFRHRIDVQLRFNDIDILGHVNNTRYFSLYDTGKAHYFNVVRQGKMNWQRVETVIANVDCAFLHPILFGEEVEVLTRCLNIGEKSFEIEQMLCRKSDGLAFSLCRTVMVCFEPATGKTLPVSEELRDQLRTYENVVLENLEGKL